MKLTFLEGWTPMVKRFHPDGVESYPPVKKFTSWEFDIDPTAEGMREIYELVKKHAGFGHAMLKGPLIRPLARESRAGLSNTTAPADTIVFDIDELSYGVPAKFMQAPWTEDRIRSLADYIVTQMLPAPFRDTSYIIHASSSLGVKPGTVSLHLMFALAAPVPVNLLKQYLTSLNLTIPAIEQQLTLSASGTALKFTIDRTLADNSRIIYIGHPIFEGVDNPIDDAHRILLAERQKPVTDLSGFFDEFKGGKVQSDVEKKVRTLREMNGLPKLNPKTQGIRFGNTKVAVVTNPDHVQMVEAYDKGPFVYYNINGGDSCAYYVYKENPQIVYNFKGEPNFLFEAASPEAFHAHIQKYSGTSADEDQEGESESPSETEPSPPMPFVFRDRNTNIYYHGFYHLQEKRLRDLKPTGRTECEDWMREHGGVMPDPIPSFNYTFDPRVETSLDFEKRFINQYVPSPLLHEPAKIPEGMYNANRGNCHDHLRDICPTVYKILLSICGDGEDEVGYLVNWLAALVNERDKLNTAWVMHGVQGTGKGVFFQYIMMPILGDRHATIKRAENIDEQYNSWMQHTLLAILDEFNAGDCRDHQNITNKLKNYITERTATIRRMRTDQFQVPNYCNFMVFSNDAVPVIIQEGDRRFNVCPRQKVKLNVANPGIEQDIRKELPKEVQQFAAYLRFFNYELNTAQTALSNDAKRSMANASKSAVDEFAEAINAGDLNYFLNILNEDIAASVRTDTLMVAQNTVKRWARELAERPDTANPMKLTAEELMPVYTTMVGPISSSNKLSRLLAHKGVPATRFRSNGIDIKCRLVSWNADPAALQDIVDHYIADRMPATLRAVTNKE